MWDRVHVKSLAPLIVPRARHRLDAQPITSVHSPPSFSRSIASRPITSRARCSIIVILFPERRRRNCCTLGKRIVTLLFNPGSANRANNEDHCAPCQRNLPTIFPSIVPSVRKEERKGKERSLRASHLFTPSPSGIFLPSSFSREKEEWEERVDRAIEIVAANRYES